MCRQAMPLQSALPCRAVRCGAVRRACTFLVCSSDSQDAQGASIGALPRPTSSTHSPRSQKYGAARDVRVVSLFFSFSLAKCGARWQELGRAFCARGRHAARCRKMYERAAAHMCVVIIRLFLCAIGGVCVGLRERMGDTAAGRRLWALGVVRRLCGLGCSSDGGEGGEGGRAGLQSVLRAVCCVLCAVFWYCAGVSRACCLAAALFAGLE